MNRQWWSNPRMHLLHLMQCLDSLITFLWQYSQYPTTPAFHSLCQMSLLRVCCFEIEIVVEEFICRVSVEDVDRKEHTDDSRYDFYEQRPVSICQSFFVRSDQVK